VIESLIKIGNKLDSLNLIREADAVDALIRFAGEAKKRTFIKNDLSIPVSLSMDGGGIFRPIAPGNMIEATPEKKVVVKCKVRTGGEKTLTFEWSVISSAPRDEDVVKLSSLSEELTSIGLAAVIDESRRNKTLKDGSGYTYQIGWNGEYLRWSRDGKEWKILNQSYPKWSEVVKNINKMEI
jgi:hypothetical protein